jgi:hypothetical protein
MNAVNPANLDTKQVDIGGGAARHTRIDLDALGNVAFRLVPLKAELDGLIKQWDESTERYHAAAGSDDMNGNLKQQSTQAKQDADQHSKATSKRAQRTADTSQEAAQQYSSTDGENGVTITKVGDQVVGVQPAGGGGSGSPSADFNAPAATQAGADFNAPATAGGLSTAALRTPAATIDGPVQS